MRFEFIVNAVSGINVIPDFEVKRLCILEGRNGVGKTLSIRLLQLATGVQPYIAAQAAWDSLRAGLRDLRIRITELRFGDVLEIDFTPSTWPNNPTKSSLSLGRARLNGKSIDFQTIPSILRVTRIGGDEDIVAQFQRVIATDAAVVRQQYSRLNTLFDKLNKIDSELVQDIEVVSREELGQLLARKTEIEEQLVSASQIYNQQSATAGILDQLNRNEIALKKLKEQGPGITLQLKEIEAKLADLQSAISMLSTRHSQLLSNALSEQNLLDEIEQLHQKQKRQTEQVSVTATKLDVALAELQLSDVNEIVYAQQEAKTKLEEQEYNRDLLVAPTNLITLIKDLRLKLEAVRGSSLDTKVVANIGQRAVLARELRTGLFEREQELTRMEQQTFLVEINADIQTLNDRLQLLSNAAKLKNEHAQKQRALFKLEEELRLKTIELDANRDAEYQQIAENLERLRQQELEWSVKKAVLVHIQGTLEDHGTIDDLELEIASIHKELLETAGTIETFEEAQAKLNASQNYLQDTREKQARVLDTLDDFLLRLERTLTLLNQSPDYEWLRNAIAEQLPTINDDHKVALERLKQLGHAIQRFEKILDHLSRSTGQLQETLEQLAKNQTQDKDNNYMPVIISHYENQFGVLLADPNIQNILFDNGTFERLNLQQQVVIWKNADGVIGRKPLEAFSSGERAFTYVLGSILQQQKVKSQNHLMVLDEFGAFIEADRIERLERFLYDEVLQVGTANAVAIILPSRKQLSLIDDNRLDLIDVRTRQLFEHGYSWNEVELLT